MNSLCSDVLLCLSPLSLFWNLLWLVKHRCKGQCASCKPPRKRQHADRLHSHPAKGEHAALASLAPQGRWETESRVTPAAPPTRDQERQANCWMSLRGWGCLMPSNDWLIQRSFICKVLYNNKVFSVIKFVTKSANRWLGSLLAK